LDNVEEAVRNGDNLEARRNMMLGANYAGKAIAITKTTACHSLSYPMTSLYGIPHGHAVAVTLPSVLLYNSKVTEEDCVDKRGVEYVRDTMRGLLDIMKVGSYKEARDLLLDKMSNIGIETDLSKLGVDKETVISRGFAPERMGNNPRLITPESLRTDILGAAA